MRDAQLIFQTPRHNNWQGCADLPHKGNLDPSAIAQNTSADPHNNNNTESFHTHSAPTHTNVDISLGLSFDTPQNEPFSDTQNLPHFDLDILDATTPVADALSIIETNISPTDIFSQASQNWAHPDLATNIQANSQIQTDTFLPVTDVSNLAAPITNIDNLAPQTSQPDTHPHAASVTASPPSITTKTSNILEIAALKPHTAKISAPLEARSDAATVKTVERTPTSLSQEILTKETQSPLLTSDKSNKAVFTMPPSTKTIPSSVGPIADIVNATAAQSAPQSHLMNTGHLQDDMTGNSHDKKITPMSDKLESLSKAPFTITLQTSSEPANQPLVVPSAPSLIHAENDRQSNIDPKIIQSLPKADLNKLNDKKEDRVIKHHYTQLEKNNVNIDLQPRIGVSIESLNMSGNIAAPISDFTSPAMAAIPPSLGVASTVAPTAVNTNMAQPFTAPAEANVTRVSQAVMQINHTNNTMQVQLDPPEMGRVYIDFIFETEQLSKIVIKFDTAEAQAQLRQQSHILIQNLQESGIEFAPLEFHMNQNGAQKNKTPSDFLLSDASENTEHDEGEILNTGTAVIKTKIYDYTNGKINRRLDLRV